MLRFAKDISYAGDCDNVLRTAAVFLDFLAESTDVHAESAGANVLVISPHLPQQLIRAADLADIGH